MLSLYLNLGFGAYFLAMVFYTASLFFVNPDFAIAKSARRADRLNPIGFNLVRRGNPKQISNAKFGINKILPYLARFFIASGIISLSIYILTRWQIALRPPLSNMFESLVIFSWVIALTVIILDLRYKIKGIAVLATLMSLSALGYASLLDKEIMPLVPALKSNWLTIHVLACFIGYSGLTVGFISSAIFLCKQKNEDKDLDKINYKMIAFGFLFLTLGIITGSVWANSAWGSYWSWDPKETWSLITWFIYAAYLHVRLRKGWKGKRAAWLSVIGFAAMLFTYFGVNFLLSGLHSYGA